MVLLNHMVSSHDGRHFNLDRLPLGDAVNARHFLSRILLPYLTGYEYFPGQAPPTSPAGQTAEITHEQDAEMDTFSRRVARLRTMIGADPDLTRLLNNADDRSPALQQALVLVDEGASLARITALLRQSQRATTPSPLPQVAVPVNARPPVVEVQPLVPADEPAEETPQETPQPAGPTVSLIPGQQVSFVS
jgi:hypothetical protein